MFGHGLMFLFCLGASLILTLWMLVRIWRRSPLLAIASFLFWPASIIALIRYWGDEDSDIRVPFFLSLVATALLAFMAMRTVDAGINEMAATLSDEDMAEVRRENPAMADQLERARTQAHGNEDKGAKSPSQTPSTTPPRPAAAPPAPQAVAAVTNPESTHVAVTLPPEAELAEQEAQHRSELAQAATSLSWRVGTVDLSPAPAQLKLPSQFRLLARQWVIRLARLHGAPYDNHAMGWVVHQSVDLGREDTWFVQVRFYPQTERFTPPSVTFGEDSPEALAAYVARIAEKVDPGNTTALVAPNWDKDAGMATWQSNEEDINAPASYYAVRVVEGGLLAFVVSNLDEAHAELAQRSVRLIASRAQPFKHPSGG